MSMFKTGLLVLVSPISRLKPHLKQLIEKASVHVENTLYVHLAPELQNSATSQVIHVPLTRCVKQTVHQVYTIGERVKGSPDIRILLSNIGGTEQILSGFEHKLHKHYEVVLSEKQCDQLNHYVTRNFPQVPLETKSLTLNLDVEGVESELDSCDMTETLKTYSYVVLGGTFDRLHTGHSILLSEASMLANRGITIGVTDGPMTKKKTLCELIRPVEERIYHTREYLEDCKPSLRYNIVPILDPFGPSIVEPELECIIVSQETVKGGHMVNSKRQEKGLSILDVDIIDLVEDEHHSPDEEEKISSSSQRKRLLGTLLKPPNSGLPEAPYVIGLTGGIASGKSSVCKRLESMGAAIVDCDKLGHEAYKPGSSVIEEIVETFGSEVLNENGEINRKALGTVVFSDKKNLEKLNHIVWPSIAGLAKSKIQEAADKGCSVVVLDAAVLLEAKWDTMVHEVWVCVIPQQEAVKRLADRNKLTEEEALQRINSQLTNEERVIKANVVLSTLWEPEVTQRQVEKAWQCLQKRCNTNIIHKI